MKISTEIFIKISLKFLSKFAVIFQVRRHDYETSGSWDVLIGVFLT
jgi:hypothetical protein